MTPGARTVLGALAWGILLCLSPEPPAGAQQPALRIEAPGHPPETLTLAQLRALPATSLTISFQTEHGREQAAYGGVLLWTVLEHAGMIDPAAPRDHVRQVITVTGLDGYTSVLALAEIDPSFEGKAVLLADVRNGAPIPDHPRLVVPGDRRGGRSVRDVVGISVR